MNQMLTKTYTLARPAATHRRPARCEEVNCKNYLNGWQIHSSPKPQEAQRQAYLIKSSGRCFVATPEPDGTLYTFEPGQQCFGTHTIAIEREALYVVRKGSTVKQHTRPLDWVDDFSTHLDKIREQ